jgi:uncharacterized protein DUF3348
MSQTSPNIPLSSSQLVTSLADMVDVETPLAHDSFVDRLASLFDLADSLKLANANDKLFRMEFRSDFRSAAEVRKEFIRAKRAIVAVIIKSFEPGDDHIRVRLPQPPALEGAEEAATASIYQKFYAAMQRQLEVSVLRLQDDVRTSVSGLSLNMARLAALDTTMHNTLQAQTRKSFAVIPSLIAQRFEQLRQQYLKLRNNATDQHALWQLTLEQFSREMRGVILAETDARLLPVLGLVEATNQDIE